MIVAESAAWGLIASDVTKRYGRAIALDGANLRARYGEIHALLGENGAGKSTICKIVSGSVNKDSGILEIGGETVGSGSIRNATRLGVGTVFQELSLIPDLTVAENLALGNPHEFSFLGVRTVRRLRGAAESILDELGISGIRTGARVRDLTLAQQQVVEIAKVVSRKPRILILDEATSSLPAHDVEWLFGITRRLRDRGTAILMISHRMTEILELADRVTVFRNGTDVAAGELSEFTEDQLVELMLGRRLEQSMAASAAAPRETVALSATGFGVKNRLHDIRLEVRAGEILGIGGLQSQGQTDLLQAFAGAITPDRDFELGGASVRFRTPKKAIASGVALVPEDRRSEGLALSMSVRDNLTMSATEKRGRLGFVSDRRESQFARDLVSKLNVKVRSIFADVGGLSGGNQQKVLIGRVLSLNSAVLLMADVTRGVDVGTKADIYQLIRELASEGTAIIYYSSDATELAALCHRVAVMRGRTIVTELEGDDITERNIIAAAVGAPASDRTPS